MKRAATILALLLLATPLHAEIVEEIVALIDGEILTSSEYDTEEQAMLQQIYQRFTGEQLDEAVAAINRTLLMDLIDRKILASRAGRMFDTDRMKEVFYSSFREQQQIQDEEQFLAALEREGMTVDDLKDRLIQMFAPEEVVRFEVSSRLSVADKEVDAYYAEHPEEFMFEDEVKLREIILLAESDSDKETRRAEATTLWESLTTENFATKAEEVSEAGTKEAGGLLGTIKRGDLSEDLEQIAFALEAGQRSELLERPYGFHILFAETAQVGKQRTLEEVRNELRIQLEDKLYAERLSEFMTKARGESEWCVRAKFLSRVPEKYADKQCKEM